jgi:DNA polymerase-3 subunit epsilon
MSDQYESSDDMSRRVVIFDTETTGLGSEHEIVEIAMIETIEGIKTGRYIHFFVNPDCENTKKAYEIHRLTKESLSSHPKFWQIAHKIATFVGTSSMMAHNAKFDMGMLNRGMIKGGLRPYPPERFICTKKMANTLFPGERAGQDPLCHKFGVDNFNRETTGIHSAIEDTVQLYHIFRGMIPLLEKKNLCWSMFRLS